MKTHLTLLAVICSLYSAHGQYSLPLCQEKARANYPAIKQYDLIARSAEFNISNAGKAYLPHLSVTGIAAYIIKGLPELGPSSESPDKFQFIGIGQLNQTIWDGGTTRSQKEMIKANADVEKANLDVAFHSIVERVNQLYFGILLMDEQIKLLKILKENLDRNLNAVKLSNENGLAYSSDVDEVKVELIKADQRMDELIYTRKAYIQMLSVMMAEPLRETATFEKPSPIQTFARLEVVRPELSLYNFQRSQVQAQDKMTRTGIMPKLGLLGAGILIEPGVAFGPEKMKSLAIAGLSLSWNTGSAYRSSNNRELTKISLDRINAQQETFLFNTQVELAHQSNDIEKRRLVLEKDQEIVMLKANIKKAYELKYQSGMCTMNDLIRVTNAESEAKSNQALHEVQLLADHFRYKTTTGN